ncbi:unnamed protein product [Rotaria sp. Silwood1]|nr:unnamed protein product [Rotaria sp. Silwood1]CAF1369838.1 unnamed protein product [Rotaria sp. Silwood1]CAF3611869.1 unnamed protein product [Rotaria sp. Silwood1]CAF3666651.1 unnamed protein product [Rotaria sp. Silwood1]CAF4921293.1 unnamed protein product [Rotaria sp. Silwood1]
MFFDILVVFVVSLISSLFLCTASVYGLPSSSTTKLHYIDSSPSDDLSSSLSLFNHRPVPSVDNDLSGDNLEMLIGDSNENDDLSLSSIDISNEPYEFDIEPSSSSSLSSSSLKFLFRKSLLLPNQQHDKRALSSSSKINFNFNTAANKLADSFHTKNVANLNQLNEPIRLSSSLKHLVETNPLARAWLTMLIQKLMQEQTMPYIFKYGRRRK